MNDGITTTQRPNQETSLLHAATDALGPEKTPSAAQSTDHGANVELVIEPKSGWVAVDFRELWLFHELLWFLVWRDIKVRYKQTVLGVAWAVLVPVFSVTIFTVIFGNFAGLKNELPAELIAVYPVYVYAGLLPWLFFSNAISVGGQTLVSQRQLLTKIYFPRLFVPTATVTSGLVDMAISFGVFAVMMAIYGVVPSPRIVLLPLLILLAWAASLGIAFTLSALTVTYRDFRFVIPFMVQAWQFVSPVVYPTAIVPERYRYFYALNPLAGIIEGFRSVIFGTPFPWAMLCISTLSTAALLVYGVMYFRKTERRFADIA
ncbi:Teichoic acid translocation permease protein TagG [Symmachiella dynata]|uniref:ABC transporter permease n=1 Tax=Symmachiella dynata TaxID=2527995 RepID=UPI00118AD70E|nr:ABC transporter permease [Symmachiella dynata]QDT47283.1 Teichoic acid translocation permease protein TagG [Symmachiella dynata]